MSIQLYLVIRIQDGKEETKPTFHLFSLSFSQKAETVKPPTVHSLVFNMKRVIKLSLMNDKLTFT